MPPADGNAFLATFVANTLHGAFPPLDLLAICLVQAMVAFCYNIDGWKHCVFTCFSPSHGVFFLFCQSGAHALKISGHRSRTVIFVFLISIISKSRLFSSFMPCICCTDQFSVLDILGWTNCQIQNFCRIFHGEICTKNVVRFFVHKIVD
jgi:hypothetical protein